VTAREGGVPNKMEEMRVMSMFSELHGIQTIGIQIVKTKETAVSNVSFPFSGGEPSLVLDVSPHLDSPMYRI